MAVWIPACPGGQKLRPDTGETAISFTLIVVTLLFPIFEIVIHVVGTVSIYIPKIIVGIGSKVKANPLIFLMYRCSYIRGIRDIVWHETGRALWPFRG